MRRIFNVLAPLGTVIALMPAPLRAQDGAALFTDNCAPCHNIGEAGGVGPDLRDIAQRRDRTWLLAFVPDPASKDKAATMPPADLHATRWSRSSITSTVDPPRRWRAQPPRRLPNRRSRRKT